jgi:hypothetical protein
MSTNSKPFNPGHSPISKETGQEDLTPRCHVGFSILGSSLDFDGISAELNQPSASTGRAGSQRATGPLLEDVWNIASPLAPLRPLDEHLEWLRKQLEPHIEFLKNLSRTADMRIYIGFTLSREQNGFAIPAELIRLFASFNAFIQMYILCNFGEDLAD